MADRVQVFQHKNGQGKVFKLPKTLEELIKNIDSKFGTKNAVIYTKEGAEIDDIELIRDNEELYLEVTKENFKLQASENSKGLNDWIKLNVGGKVFMTTRSTLISTDPEDSIFTKMFETSNNWKNSCDESGAVKIDRSPKCFQAILDYLRCGQVLADYEDSHLSLRGILVEAQFFGLTSLENKIKNLIENKERSNFGEPLTRRMVIKSLLNATTTSELRYQGVDLSGCDLSRLDLRGTNFKLAVMRNCDLRNANMAGCSLERTDLSGSNLDGANLQGARMMCCNAEGCSMKGCQFDDPSDLRATNMEGAIMKGVDLAGSRMAGVNLRVATLKASNLKNCDLRGAILAGADLENCDLSGCDLAEANLRGCNVRGTKFEKMLTPLHMTQSVS